MSTIENISINIIKNKIDSKNKRKKNYVILHDQCTSYKSKISSKKKC